MQVISGKVERAKKIVIYGPEGIGKSSLAAQFPNPIFIDTEGSTTEMVVNRLAKPTSWTMLKQQVDWVKQQAGKFNTLVIDTIDWAEMLCVDSVCAQYGKKSVEDFGYGNGYVYTKEEFGRFLNQLSDVIDAGIHVVLVAHAQIIKFEQPDEMGAYDRYQLKLGKKTSSQTAPLVKEWADMVLFINYKTYSVASKVDSKGKATGHKAQGGERVIYTTHHPAWDAKNRHGLPEELPLDYSKIAHIFIGNFTSTPSAMSTQAPLQQNTIHESAQPSHQQSTTIESTLNPNIPRSLRDLMIQHQVSETDIQIVVSKKGYYPMDTPIANYDPNFIEGVLVGAWSKVYEMIQETNKKLPF